ncbi:hypothetical protein, partial [Klebsiella variicola]|uniref:hypothetical protein n=1 Tax=Klebsiella variicola TaxID=244366 RepID=UPI001C9E4E4A
MVRVHSDAPISYPSVISVFYHLPPDGIADLKCCVLAKIFPCIFHTRAGEANPFKYIFEHIEMAL